MTGCRELGLKAGQHTNMLPHLGRTLLEIKPISEKWKKKKKSARKPGFKSFQTDKQSRERKNLQTPVNRKKKNPTNLLKEAYKLPHLPEFRLFKNQTENKGKYKKTSKSKLIKPNKLPITKQLRN